MSEQEIPERKNPQRAHCIIVFVGVNAGGRPVPVSPWEPVTEEGQSLEKYAVKLMGLRKAIEEEMGPRTDS